MQSKLNIITEKSLAERETENSEAEFLWYDKFKADFFDAKISQEENSCFWVFE